MRKERYGDEGGCKDDVYELAGQEEFVKSLLAGQKATGVIHSH